jgi:putative ATP-dependent endonuclease of OLD family
MRLTHINIENFRGITSLALELDPLTVVIGENNHGKTSLFDVLDRCLGESADGEDGAWEFRDFRRDADGVPSPIRVVLSFEESGGPGARSLSDRLFSTAMTAGPDGVPRLRAEWAGRPGSGTMHVRLLDSDGRPLEVPAQGAVLRRLRRLHPVFVVRLAQPPPQNTLDWVSHAGRRDFDAEDGDDPEEAIAQLYHRLTSTRGTIPTEEVRRGLQAARALRVRMAGGNDGSGGPVARILDRFIDDAAGAGPTPITGGGSHNLGMLMVLGSLLEARGRIRLAEEANPIIAIEEPEVHLHPMLLSSTWAVIEDLRAQTLVTTNSGELLSEIPLHHLRRLARRNGRIEAFRLGEGTLSADALRRVAYHVRAKRGVTLFARCWILVEGETEYWLVRELASVLGYDLEGEGVRCVEFAQCGVAPLLRLANDLGIQWHVLSDGDESGVAFANDAARQLRNGKRRDHVTHLDRRNMEMLLYHHGFEDVYTRAAGLPVPEPNAPEERRPSPRRVVERAIRAHSKPYLALMVAEESRRRGADSVPGPLRHVIETAVRLARDSIEES